jgi:hypothetical protein
MMTLTKEDMKALLLIASPAGQKNTPVLVQSQWERLEDDGLVKVGDRTLTEGGRKKAESISQLLRDLYQGVPFHRRKKADPARLSWTYTTQRDLLNKWVTSSVANKTFTTNRETMIFGPPDNWMKAEKEKGLGPKVIDLLRDMGGRTYHQVTPAWFQTDGTLEPDVSVIWLRPPDTSDAVQPEHTGVQAHYFDYLMERFPTATLFAAEGSFSPIQFRVINKGISKLNIVAILMPMKMVSGWPVPGGADA